MFLQAEIAAMVKIFEKKDASPNGKRPFLQRFRNLRLVPKTACNISFKSVGYLILCYFLCTALCIISPPLSNKALKVLLCGDRLFL